MRITSDKAGQIPDKTIAAITAAVQAYLEDENISRPSGHEGRLSAWKTASWQPFRSGMDSLQIHNRNKYLYR